MAIAPQPEHLAIGQHHIERLRASMRDHGIDALLCLKPHNSYYITGFNPIIYSHPVVAILPLEGEPALLVHALRDDHARQSAWISDVRLFGSWSTKKTMGQNWLAALTTILDEHSLLDATIGIEPDFLPIGTMDQFREHLPNVTFTDASHLIMESRMIKSPEEIEILRAASRIADIGMDVAIETARQRKSEREVSVRAMAAMNEVWLNDYPEYEVADFANAEGGVHNGLWCFCLAGDHIFFNCDNPTTRVLQDGELALIIIWTNLNGLHAENERTVALGEVSDPVRKMYEAVLTIRESAWDAIKPGATCADVYNAAASTYHELGYGAYLPGRIGHALGLGGHEHPSLAPDDHTVLKPGMVLAYEPNLRIPGTGGLQHSDTLVITDDGHEVLTKTDRGYLQV